MPVPTPRYLEAMHARLLLLLLAGCLLTHAQTAPDIKAKVAKIFAPYNRTDGPGCAVAVQSNNAPPVMAAYGMADLEHNIANTPDTVFEAGSVTKQFTAAAVLLLAQRGKLSLDDPIRKHFPELPETDTSITVRDLLYHTSGLRDWGEVAAIGGWPRTTREYTHAHVLDILTRQHALNYPPGTAWSYTNSGYNLAAMLVERVTGEPLRIFTEREFFGPLGMTATTWRDDYHRVIARRAIAYTEGRDGFRQQMPFEDVYGNGGLLTTVGDLLKWNDNLDTGKVGGRDLTEAQQKPGVLRDGMKINYGAGLFFDVWKGYREVSHSGATAAYRAWLARYPEQHLSIAVLCNDGAARTVELGHNVAALYFPPAQTTEPASVSVNKSPNPSPYTGLYRSLRDGSTAAIDEHEGHLRLDTEVVLNPLANGRWTSGTSMVWFETDPNTHTERLLTTNTVYGRDVWEKVKRVQPTRAQLERFVGEYKSDEAETTFRIALEKDGLVLHRRPDSSLPLRPLYENGFDSDIGVIRFLQDRSGKYNELSVGEGRVWDLRFERVAAH